MPAFLCLKLLKYVTVAFSVSLGVCSSLSAKVTDIPNADFTELHLDLIQFCAAPDKVEDGSLVLIRFQCSRPCELGLEVVLSTSSRPEVLVFRQRWTNFRLMDVPRVHPVVLHLPPAVAYRTDFFHRRTLEVRDVMLRAWLCHSGPGLEACSYQESLVRTSRELGVVPPSERPAKPPTGTPTWGAELLWRVTRDRVHQCRHEPVTVDMLKFPLASTGERFGVVRRFSPFTNRELERARIQAVERPRWALSVWVYLLRWCDAKLCGIIHHVGSNETYEFPLMQLTSTGDIVIQAHLVNGEDQAFQGNTALPLRTWTRLDFSIQDSKVTLEVAPLFTTGKIHIFQFHDNIIHNDTSGYFVIGGSAYIPGINGYFGPIKYYRFGTEKVVNPLSPERILMGLDEAHEGCEDIRRLTAVVLHHLTDDLLHTSSCHAHYVSLWNRLGQNTCSQTWSWETQTKHRELINFLQNHQEALTAESWRGSLYLGRELFDHVVDKLSGRGRSHRDTTSSLMALLQVSSCLGHHRASLLLATLHLAGLEGPGDQLQGQVFGLMGAAGDDRLALMHLGYKHTQGLDGFPKDFDMAYAYYSNIGTQTVLDKERVLESEQYTVEHVHLSSQEEVDSLSHQSGDTFHFLKFQAERGDVESQKALAKILLGQNGVIKDVVSALKWYEMIALQNEDPTAMYEYSILLLKGQGVKRNRTLGLHLMKKAAAMGSTEALNGLGWYYSFVLKDYRSALRYFEQAAQKGDHNAIYNLGVYHLNGNMPGTVGRNKTAAFHLFLNASNAGHMDGAVHAAWYLSTGNLPGVSRDAETAVIMLKHVCEHNGFLGYVVHEAIQAFLQGSSAEALVKYALAAETGLGVAQNNAAHLCEELWPGYNCMLRYHNYSTMNYNPHFSGLLKLGDLYYYGRPGAPAPAVDRAISLYTRAALANSPQGLFNMVALTKKGHVLPPYVLRGFNVSPQDDQDTIVEKLLLRCVQLEDKGEDVMPCSLVLLWFQMGKAWSLMTQDPVQISLAYTTVVTVLIALIMVLIQNVVELVHVFALQTNTSGTTPVSQAATNGYQTQDDRVRREAETTPVSQATANGHMLQDDVIRSEAETTPDSQTTTNGNEMQDDVVGREAGTAPVSQIMTNGNVGEDGVVRSEVRTFGEVSGVRIIGPGLSGGRRGRRGRRGTAVRRFQQPTDWAISVSGVCLSTMATLLLYHLLGLC